jgi:hypothetical protein
MGFSTKRGETMNGKWRLEGQDAFSGEKYHIRGEYDDESQALDAARLWLTTLEMNQPTEETGGQDEHGIQDRIYVVRPNGTRYRFVEHAIED